MSPSTVGLAGITGKFGRLLAASLLKNPNVSLRGFARNPAKLPTTLRESSRVELFVGEAFDQAAIERFVTGCDVVVCAYLGDDTLMVDGQKALIDACETAGVARYVASDWSLDYTKLKLGELFPKDPMILVKDYLGTKRTVKGVHILVGAFMDMWMSPFFRVWDPQTQTLRYWGEGTEPWEGTSYVNAAEFTAAVIADPTAVGIKKYLGDRKTIKEIAATLEAVHGIQPKLERLGSLEDLKATMLDSRANNPADFFSYVSMFFTYYWINGQTFVGPETDNERYAEVKPETWEDYLRSRTLEELPSAYFAVGA